MFGLFLQGYNAQSDACPDANDRPIAIEAYGEGARKEVNM